MIEKTCTKCGETKPLEAFAKAKRGLHGRNSRCKVCKRAMCKEWRRENAEHKRAYQQDWRAANAERMGEYRRARYLANLEAEKEYSSNYQSANRAKYTALENKRRAAELSQTIMWTEAHKKAVDALYEEAARLTKDTGTTHHVDHIYPLRGRDSHGLHVVWNLRVVPAEENLRKSNKVDPRFARAAVFDGVEMLV